MWMFSSYNRLKHFPHVSHEYGRWSLWVTLWRIRRHLEVYSLPQTSQERTLYIMGVTGCVPSWLLIISSNWGLCVELIFSKTTNWPLFVASVCISLPTTPNSLVAVRVLDTFIQVSVVDDDLLFIVQPTSLTHLKRKGTSYVGLPIHAINAS